MEIFHNRYFIYKILLSRYFLFQQFNIDFKKKIEESYVKDEPEANEPEEDQELSFEKELTEDESDYDEQERDSRTRIYHRSSMSLTICWPQSYYVLISL